MGNIKIEITEDKGSGKRYGIKATEVPNGFEKFLFGAKEKVYKVLLMSRPKISPEKAKEMLKTLFDNQEAWKENKGKKCDYLARLSEYPLATFFITNTTCNNDATKTSKKTDDQ
ncbi:hypothetical protein [Aureispira anguillae]|uniref:Uncharacterized protein n=1 Tax=Aureispira anguillae TaxID=2864201 RepID=A0A915YBP6_9BACT|nr:hypothetical protein [Aureispira anguillae]BDS10114.1 hypothetical protein AsAng_0008210 [Aureispira anguillae]